MATYHRSEFLKEMKDTWPQLTQDINAEHGLLHLEMDVVRRFAQHLIDSGNREELVRCLAIIQKYWLYGNSKLQNAIDISFIEDLDFNDTKRCRRRWAWDLFPAPLKQLYVNFHGKLDT